MAVIDLTNQRFGNLLVLERDLSKIGGSAYWICQCDCGKMISTRGSNLRSGEKTNCGCKTQENRRKNIDTTSQIGKKFGRLTVIKRDLSAKIGHGCSSKWICQCDCGKFISVDLTSLNRGSTKSCGCLRKELRAQKNIKDITNQRFGMVVAKERLNEKNNHNSFLWRCECDCGNKNYITSTEDLLSGKINSCGCKHKSFGEIEIEKILQDNEFCYNCQQTFSDLKELGNGYLRFDFSILQNNQIIRLIEFDGEQHFKDKSFYKENLEIRKQHDKIKNNYAKNHNIPLVRIPYTKLNHITLEDLMGKEYEV